MRCFTKCRLQTFQPVTSVRIPVYFQMSIVNMHGKWQMANGDFPSISTVYLLSTVTLCVRFSLCRMPELLYLYLLYFPSFSPSSFINLHLRLLCKFSTRRTTEVPTSSLHSLQSAKSISLLTIRVSQYQLSVECRVSSAFCMHTVLIWMQSRVSLELYTRVSDSVICKAKWRYSCPCWYHMSSLVCTHQLTVRMLFYPMWIRK
jgi:hypothetical protein